MSNLPSRFNAVLARRSQPGHCPRCGRPYAGEGWCEDCKANHRAWKRARRVEAAKTAEEQATIADVLLELRELRETVRIQARKLAALTATGPVTSTKVLWPGKWQRHWPPRPRRKSGTRGRSILISKTRNSTATGSPQEINPPPLETAPTRGTVPPCANAQTGSTPEIDPTTSVQGASR